MGNHGQKHLVLMISAITFSVSLFALVWSSWHWVSRAVLLVVEAGSMTYVSTTTTVLQLTVPREMRGRVLSIWTLSAALIGALPMGVMTDTLGWRFALTGGGGLCFMVFVYLGLWRPALRRLEI